MELIGRKVRGFRFENRGHGNLIFDPKMCDFIGKIGTIKDYYEDINRCAVIFEDFTRWIYPAELIKEHLVEETTVSETITLPLINGIPDLSGFEGVEMMVRHEDEKNWYKSKVLAYSGNYITHYDVHKYAKPIPAKKKITADEIKKMFNCEDFEIV